MKAEEPYIKIFHNMKLINLILKAYHVYATTGKNISSDNLLSIEP